MTRNHKARIASGYLRKILKLNMILALAKMNSLVSVAFNGVFIRLRGRNINAANVAADPVTIPHIRSAHLWSPVVSINLLILSEKTTPPSPAPPTVMPIAVAMRLSNHVGRMKVAGMKTMTKDIPTNTP